MAVRNLNEGWSETNQGRQHPNYKERGPARYTYTYEDLALITGMKVASLHVAKSRGDFDIKDLVSVAEYICRKRGWTAPTR